MASKKLIRIAIAGASPLAKALRRKKAGIGAIVYGAEKSLPELHRAARMASDAVIGGQIYTKAGNLRDVSAAINQMLQGAQSISRTPTVELLATSGLPEGVRYRKGILLFAEAYDWLQQQ
jgi:hypothetical protein